MAMGRTKFLARDLDFVVSLSETVGGGTALTTPFGVAATDILTATAHGREDGDLIRFTALTGGSGLTTATDYYIRDKTTNTFKLAQQPGGTAIDFTSDISAGSFTPISQNYVAVEGLKTLTHSPATERADTTGFDDEGRAAHIVAQRGDSWELEGNAVGDATVTGEGKDPGQARMEALSRAVGNAAKGFFQITDPMGNKLRFGGSVEVTLPGGGHNDAATWGATVTVSGIQGYIPSTT